jgi:dephospho-CoA kinase
MSSGILRNEKGIFVLDAALIFELGIEEHLDFTVTVSDSRERSLERLQKRDGLSGEAAYGRWNSQIDIQEKCQRSSFVIENSGSLSDLKDNAEYFYINVINKMEDA